ncbi:olfactory receptor 1020-like [Microcaecilia unicolor]|uniref:Olfactory receptor n=1 Tax=Microcaecilia unicolor TaxID=1415580 RepID=A0A6P7WXN3_9AMPH|nr:olfactory receptor 1020-like [Microcaecilia unicolor]
MGERNSTPTTEFILLGFSDHPLLQGLICGMVLLMYLISMLGNFVFLLLMCADRHLHKPMYLFLSNLSILDVCCTSATFPKMLVNFLTQSKSISFKECMTQLFFFQSFTGSELFLLTSMAYDRYVAICNPFYYSLIMKKSICILLASGSWIITFLGELPLIIMISRLSYCASNKINHFFCDPFALIKLSCSDTDKLSILIFIEGTFVIFIPFLLTLISYIFIISTILRIRCADGRHKTFSTCSSHLTSVTLFYGTIMCIYMRPTSSMYSPAQDKLFSLLFTGLIPMLNPIIYSLRNQEIKNSIGRIRDKTRLLVNW